MSPTGRRRGHITRTAAAAVVMSAIVVAGCTLPDRNDATQVAVEAETAGTGRVVTDPDASGGKLLELDPGTTVSLDGLADGPRTVVRARAGCGSATLASSWAGAAHADAPVGAGWVDVVLHRPAGAGGTLELTATGCAVQVDFVAVRETENPLSGHTQWPNVDGRLYDAAAQLRADGRAQDAALLDALAEVPTALWLGDWLDDPARTVGQALAASSPDGHVPVFVLYNIPERDCGGFSAQHAGAVDGEEYLDFVDDVARVLHRRTSVVIVEPDALSQRCDERVDPGERDQLVARAVRTLAEANGPVVYLDAGHAGWLEVDEQAERLVAAGVEHAHGFALNVSNFRPVGESVSYAEALSGALGGKPFVLDTSRAGGDAAHGEFCNPDGVALGPEPTFTPPSPFADAFLWVKRPAESDGHCDGAPPAGELHVDALLDMAARAGFAPGG